MHDITPNMSARRLPFEVACNHVGSIVAGIEQSYFERFGEHPKFVAREDYVRLASVAFFPDLIDDSTNISTPFDLAGEGSRGISPYDIGEALVRRALERGTFFEATGNYRDFVFDAVLGELSYAPPHRAFKQRLQTIDFLLDHGLESLVRRDMTRLFGRLLDMNQALVSLEEKDAIQHDKHFGGGFRNPISFQIDILNSIRSENLATPLQGFRTWCEELADDCANLSVNSGEFSSLYL